MSLPTIDSQNMPGDRGTPEKQHLLNLSESDLKEWLAEHDQSAFRAKQIGKWVFQRRVSEFQQMTDLPQGLRGLLEEHFVVFTADVVHASTSDDGTDKLLVRLADAGEVECVLLRDGERRSICVSSQVGCAMGCVFCASGLDGVDRNLTRGEILEQMLRLQKRLDEGERLSHIVMMGMGEPLANLNHVLAALDVARSPDGLGISPRRITISTVGLPPAIDRLSDNQVPYNLAVSLHAPNNELRSELVPVNRKIGIDNVLDAADRYFQSSGRRLTFEYVLLGGVNDSDQNAQELAALLKHRNVLVERDPLQSGGWFAVRDSQPSFDRKFPKDLGIARRERQIPPTKRQRDRCRLRTVTQESRSTACGKMITCLGGAGAQVDDSSTATT